MLGQSVCQPLRTGTLTTGTVYRHYSCSTCSRQGKTAGKGRPIRIDRPAPWSSMELSAQLFTAERLTSL